MEYEVIKTLKQSERNTVLLVREKDSGELMIKKIMKGQHLVYLSLKENPHPFLPVIYEAAVTEDFTTVIEEYIEDNWPDSPLTEKQFLGIAGDLCCVLEFLHGQGFLHRDIKPSNILMAQDGHIRLIDFDAVRNYKESPEDTDQDTELLGTRIYASPEQYGFAKTDPRSDIYSLGVTLGLLGEKIAKKPRYSRILQRCTEFDPENRYPSADKLKKDLFRTALSFRGQILPHGKSILYISACTALALCALVLVWRISPQMPWFREEQTAVETILPAPADPHWDGETGIAVWGNVPESGSENSYAYSVYVYYKKHLEDPEWLTVIPHFLTGNDSSVTDGNFCFSLTENMTENGYYCFTVSAQGDNIQYLDSPYVASDTFVFTGETAPRLPVPENPTWTRDDQAARLFFNDLDQYADKDRFNIYIYDKDGNLLQNAIITKEWIMARKNHNIPFHAQYFTDAMKNTFSVQVISSRPNEYRSSVVSDPVPVTF